MGSRRQEDDWKGYLKIFDAFPKERDEAAEFFHRSVSGGVITIVTGLLMALLFFSEMGESMAYPLHPLYLFIWKSSSSDVFTL